MKSIFFWKYDEKILKNMLNVVYVWKSVKKSSFWIIFSLKTILTIFSIYKKKYMFKVKKIDFFYFKTNFIYFKNNNLKK